MSHIMTRPLKGHQKEAHEQPAQSEARVHYNIGDADAARNPHALLGQLSQHCPVRADEHGGFWILSHYDEVRKAANDPARFSSGSGVTIPSTGHPLSMLLEMDPPVHDEQRRAVQGWFSPGNVAKLEDKVREIVVELIDPVVGGSGCDAAKTLAQPLPPMVICLLLGLPATEWPLIRERSERMMALALTDDVAGAYEAAIAITNSVAEALEERRREPRDDLLTRILDVEFSGQKLSVEQAAALAFILLQAGHETTVGGVGGMIRLLAEHPDVQQRLRTHPELIPGAVEECLRLETPIPGLGRTTTERVEVNGCPIDVGQRVMLMWAAANRDATVFDNPGDFVIDRKHNRHLAFGWGIHRCLGAPLARLELNVLMEEMLRRLPHFRIDDPEGIEAHWVVTRSYSSLPIVW